MNMVPDNAMNDEWRDRATCVDVAPDLFFPEHAEVSPRAKKICWECPVRQHCLVYAILTGEHNGVWGATTPRERLLLAKKLASGVDPRHVASPVSLSMDIVRTLAAHVRTASPGSLILIELQAGAHR